MDAQFITTPAGDRLVVLTESEYERLIELAEDAADRLAVARFRKRLADGDEELLPSEMVNRILDGESPVKVWREHRGLTAKALCAKAGIAKGYLSQIETGRRAGTVETMKKIAAALGLRVDDLVS